MFALLVGFLGFAEYTMQPDFCRSCHLMEPYYQAWHQSTHRDVACVECHLEPGLRNTIKGKWRASSQAAKYLTNTYGSKPHAQVRDKSCLREECHSHRLLQGKVKWTVKTLHGRDITINFNHTPHLTKLRRGKKLRCVSCHSQMVQGQHIVVTLDTCFLCHFKGFQHGREDQTLGGCRSCHDAPAGIIRLPTGEFEHQKFIDRGVKCINCHADTLKGNGAVPRQVCWNCHNQPNLLAQYGNSSLMHRSHVTEHKVECSSCHIQIVHHLEAAGPAGIALLQGDDTHGMADTGSCGQCHRQTHAGALDLYRGVGGRGVPDMPSPMFRAQVDCIACHRFHKDRNDATARIAGQTFIADQPSCDLCHEQKYNDVLAGWRLQISSHLSRAKTSLESAQNLLKNASLDPKQQLTLQRLIDDAEQNVRLVEFGHGVHNVIYATALLNVAIDHCDQVRTTINKLAVH